MGKSEITLGSQTFQTSVLESYVNADVATLSEYFNENKNSFHKGSKKSHVVGKTFLHTFFDKGGCPTPSQFHTLMELYQRKGDHCLKIFTTQGESLGSTPLHMAVKKLEVEVRTLDHLHFKGVDFHVTSRSSGHSLLAEAVMGRRSLSFLSYLVKMGVDFKQLSNDGSNLLHLAVRAGHVDGFRYFADMGLDVNSKSGNQYTPLHCLGFCPSDAALPICKALLEKGADANSKEDEGRTALHVVSYLKDATTVIELIKLLIRYGADPYAKSNNGRVFLHNFFLNRDILDPGKCHEFVEYLKREGYLGLLNVPEDDNKSTPLHFMVGGMEMEGRTLSIFHPNEVDLNAIDKEGYSILAMAAASGRSSQFLELLMKLGADHTYQKPGNFSVLHFAASKGNLGALQLFIGLGLDVNFPGVGGNSPLHHAVMTGGNGGDCVAALIKSGANVNIRNPKNLTPLHFAFTQKGDIDGCLEIIQILLDHGANATARDDQGATFLHYLFRLQSSVQPSPPQFHQIVEFLLNRKYLHLLEVPDESGVTPLHEAVLALEPKESTMRLLRDHNVDINAADKNDDKLIKYAIEGHRTISFLTLLLEMGAESNYLNRNDQSLLHIAAKFGTLEALKFIIDLKSLAINGADRDGNTPIHFIAHVRENSLEKAKLLARGGAVKSIRAKNNSGATPLELAGNINDGLEVAEYLKSVAGPEPRKKDAPGLNS